MVHSPFKRCCSASSGSLTSIVISEVVAEHGRKCSRPRSARMDMKHSGMGLKHQTMADQTKKAAKYGSEAPQEYKDKRIKSPAVITSCSALPKASNRLGRRRAPASLLSHLVIQKNPIYDKQDSMRVIAKTTPAH
ncbi:hypothetical protein L596_001136 [Steinernema carpocapsae]|uniref:Uncharacterized protein n=1 Tax=Steinernema carpocapsae TaxID=34508 RepID=A0A4U8ULF0_STECR|nr:hypothetical protein L596_001136 [Steinernema carpocapsae]